MQSDLLNLLQVAYKTRWERRREPAFFDWEIEEASWLSLTKVRKLVEPFNQSF